MRAAEDETAREQLVAGIELLRKIQFEAAQLDLLAGPQVRQTAHELVEAHSCIFIGIDAPKDPSEPRTVFEGQAQSVFQLHGRLVEQARRTLASAPATRCRPTVSSAGSSVAVKNGRPRCEQRVSGLRLRKPSASR